jgi:hypothetical protein
MASSIVIPINPTPLQIQQIIYDFYEPFVRDVYNTATTGQDLNRITELMGIFHRKKTVTFPIPVNLILREKSRAFNRPERWQPKFHSLVYRWELDAIEHLKLAKHFEDLEHERERLEIKFHRESIKCIIKPGSSKECAICQETIIDDINWKTIMDEAKIIGHTLKPSEYVCVRLNLEKAILNIWLDLVGEIPSL